MKYEERAKRGLVLPESGAPDFGFSKSIPYLQMLEPITRGLPLYPREGGLEDQDPGYLADVQTISLLRQRILFDLREEGWIKQQDELAKKMRSNSN